MFRLRGCFWVIVICLVGGGSARAQSELWLHVTDTKDVDVRDVQFSYQGSTKLSAPTSDSGRTKLDLPSNVKPASTIYLILHAPPNMRIRYPLNARVVVPASAELTPVQVMRNGDREGLSREHIVTSIAYSLLQASIPESVEILGSGGSLTIKLRHDALEKIAKELELPSEEIEGAIRNLSNQLDDHLMKAVSALYDGKYEEAKAQLRQVTPQTGPWQFWDESNTAFLLGQSYLEEGKFTAAAESLKQSAAANADSPQVLAAYGFALFRAQQFNTATEVWDRLLVIQPDNKFIYLNQGLTYDKMGRSQDSIKSFSQFLKLDGLGPISMNVYNYLGDAYTAAGKIDEALTSYRASLKLSRTFQNSEWQANNFADLRELYKARPDGKIAIAYNEELLVNAQQTGDQKREAIILTSIAGIYAQQGKVEKALDMYANALRIADESNALSETEHLLILQGYGALLKENKRTVEAQKIQTQMQQIMAKTGPN